MELSVYHSNLGICDQFISDLDPLDKLELGYCNIWIEPYSILDRFCEMVAFLFDEEVVDDIEDFYDLL